MVVTQNPRIEEHPDLMALATIAQGTMRGTACATAGTTLR